MKNKLYFSCISKKEEQSAFYAISEEQKSIGYYALPEQNIEPILEYCASQRTLKS